MPINIFTPNMPATGTSLGFTRPLVVGNFGNYKENMEVNHEAVNSANFGKHKFLTMPQQASAPVTSADEGGIYCSAVSGRSVTFIQRESNAAEVGISMYPGSATSTFASFTNLIDLASLTDATHKNFWGFVEVRDISGAVVNANVFVKAYVGSLSPLPICTVFGASTEGLNAATFRIQPAGTTLQMQLTPALGVATLVRFTITPFYFPES